MLMDQNMRKARTFKFLLTRDFPFKMLHIIIFIILLSIFCLRVIIYDFFGD